MKFLLSLRVGPRLIFAFAILILLLLASSSLALYQFSEIKENVDEIVKENNFKSELQNDMLVGHIIAQRNYRDLILANADERDEILSRIEQSRIANAKRVKDVMATQADDIDLALREEFTAANKSNRAISDKLIIIAKSGDREAAKDFLYKESIVSTEKRDDVIRKMVDHQHELNRQSAQDIETALVAGNRSLIGFGLFACIAAALLCALITRSLSRPLAQATRIAEDIADGNLDHIIGEQPRDETGRLLTSMGRMQQQLQTVMAAQSELSQQHDAGHISQRMDESRFPGAYGRMVRESNALVASHVSVQQRLVEIMRRYAVGDLSQDMERLPGEKAALSETMDTVKSNLVAVNSEIGRLVRAAAQGDFSVRGDAEQFQYEFRAMVSGLNQLMASSDGNLKALSSLLQAIAAGDLSTRMEGEFQGVFARMRDDANSTVEQLTRIVEKIQQGSASINLAAGEISVGNEDLSRRTEQQAANLEETAASMEELTSTVRQNAEHARQANQLAQGAASVARTGGDIVGQVVSTMEQIETSSKQIAQIISVIDGISFQTNILALNAAVEAARAGDQGRGFAVVASEVRTLAQRSASAAKEIKALIDTSVDKVGDGSTLVRKAGQTMGEIVESVQRVTDIMAEISAASQEQSTGIEQVNQTVVQMDETTQQNAALVEEATAAARSMEAQANQLTDTVSVFKIKHTATATAATPTPTSAATAAGVGAVKKAKVPSPPPARPARQAVAARKPEPAFAEAEWQDF